MKLLRIFGIGSGRILKKDCHVKGIVTKVNLSSLHTVKRAVRLYTGPDNTLYSHFITFSYQVGEINYSGTLYVDLACRCPQAGETIDIYYDPANPKKYACYAFGPSAGPIGW